MQAIILGNTRDLMVAMKYFESKKYSWSDGESIMEGRKCLIDTVPFYLHIDKLRGKLSWSDKLDDSKLIHNWQLKFYNEP